MLNLSAACSGLANLDGLSIEHDAPLSRYTRFGLGGPAHILADVWNEVALRQAIGYLETNRAPFVVLGGGSNVVAADEASPAWLFAIGRRHCGRWEYCHRGGRRGPAGASGFHSGSRAGGHSHHDRNSGWVVEPSTAMREPMAAPPIRASVRFESYKAKRRAKSPEFLERRMRISLPPQPLQRE